MRVMLCPAGYQVDGTSQYRLYLPASPLQNAGCDITVSFQGPIVVWDKKWEGADHGARPPDDAKIMGVRRFDYDVIVFQRPSQRWVADVIPMLQHQGVRCVVDVDDHFDMIDKRNLAHASYDPNRSASYNRTWVNEACKRADAVVASTPVLGDRYGFGHGIVVPNRVPQRYLVQDRPQLPAIGWSGNVGTHPGDLQMTDGAVGDVLRDNPDWSCHIVGTGHGVKAALRLDDDPSNTGDWVHFYRYAYEVAQLGIGIVPLEDTIFNEAKSNLKMMEMASLGVPVVASPTAANIALHDKGVGELAPTGNRWRKYLRALVRSADYRAELAGKGREVMQGLTYERYADQWWSAWTG